MADEEIATLFLVFFFGFFVPLLAGIVFLNMRHYSRRRQISPGVFVVGSPRRQGDSAKRWVTTRKSFPTSSDNVVNPYELGHFNPLTGRINDGTAQDYGAPVFDPVFDDRG